MSSQHPNHPFNQQSRPVTMNDAYEDGFFGRFDQQVDQTNQGE